MLTSEKPKLDSHPNIPEFAHTAEKTFSTILDYYGIAWEYEPRTFELEWDDRKNVVEAFTPDFYLPEQDLYIELTTLRARLIAIKNRKIRRVRELYPGIHIKLVKRRNMRDLMIKYGLESEAQPIMGDRSQSDHQNTKTNEA